MATALDTRAPAAAPGSEPPERRAAPRRLLLEAAVVAAGVAVAYLVGRDGSPLWQLARAGFVLVGAAAFVRRVARRTSGRGAVALVTVGLPLAAAGAGFAGPHLAKNGITAVTIAGAVALVVGLVLFVRGTLGLLRLVRRWQRPLLVVGLLGLAYVVGVPVTFAVAVTNVPRTDLEAETPRDHGIEYADVAFEAADGVTLSGWYVPSANGAAVVLAHGAGSTRSGALDHAVVLARRGYGVLLYDARGHGRSDGRAMDFGWYGDDDLSGAVSFLVAQPDVHAGRIAVLGLSMGGEEAIGAAASDERIRAVVAEGATNRVAGDKTWLSDEYGFTGWMQERVDALTYGLTDLLTAASPPITLRDAVERSAVRTLLIAAGDVPDEERAGRHIRSASPDTVELWVVPATGHTDALRTHPADWERRVLAFLASALG